MFKRLININQESKHSVFIFGPRGTGKTSWLKQHFGDALYFDLLNDDIYTELSARPTRLNDKIPDGYQGWVIVDEVQKIPAILNEVHRLIEGRNLRFILTGSSARKLKAQGVNLLAGRALTYHMHPLTCLELGEQFSLTKSLVLGHLPMAITSNEPEKYLSSYVASYLREEVLQEGLTRNIALFTRFLETASFSQGEVLNYTAISREIASNRHTVANFFEILEDLLIACRVPVFSKRATRDMVNSPKFYYFDAGVYRSIRPQGPLDSASEIDGATLETLFLQEAKAYNDYFDLGYSFYYWRTRDKKEVDFILYGKKGFFAFEIKRKARLDTKDFKGLKAFAKDYPEAKFYMLYGGNETYFEGNVQVVPFKQALRNLPKLLSGVL
ncbi:MAG: ATPase [Gammaproteobacteria bacterium CG11_big_fil_rev_8_21_14_0_20_46_22]|nr:MAG: ATPase [Gammaproteobacteria bacterium CG12_big_fil_rev_8_21_14_0_65_46_12]PIR11741.1 MAG: ATPase [Gammaproteobacteria bacterium CG11_big_fil_rev_8_21_14_0_20_46_22]